MKKNYNIILTHPEWDKLKPELVAKGIEFHPSGYYEDVYVGIYATEEQVQEINGILDQIYEEVC